MDPGSKPTVEKPDLYKQKLKFIKEVFVRKFKTPKTNSLRRLIRSRKWWKVSALIFAWKAINLNKIWKTLTEVHLLHRCTYTFFSCTGILSHFSLYLTKFLEPPKCWKSKPPLARLGGARCTNSIFLSFLYNVLPVVIGYIHFHRSLVFLPLLFQTFSFHI